MVGVGHARRSTDSLTELQWAAIALAILTGLVHVYAGAVRARPSLLLAGLGFFGGIALSLYGYRRRLLTVAGIVYVLAQIVLWVVFNAGEYTPLGFVDKAIQIVLLGVLAFLLVSNDEDSPTA